jgi:ATP-dependent helicase HrpA
MTILKEQDIAIKSPPRNPTPIERYAAIHCSILSGFLSNIANKKEKNIYRASRGREVMIFPGSTLFNRNVEWIVAAEIVKTSRLFARNVAGINPTWLEALGGSLCRSSYEGPHWEKNLGEVRAFENVTLYGLTIVSRRPVSYGSINPVEAHEIFIGSGLVKSDIKPEFDFLKHNREIINGLEGMEDKLRRRDILAGEEVLADFYSKRLQGIDNIRSLSRLIKEKQGDDFLKVKDEDLLLTMPDRSDLAMFPDELTVGDAGLKATYRFLPGKEEDGVTINVPSTLAPEIPWALLEWGIPGLVNEKITALIKGLPKRYRKKLVPVSGTVDVIIREMVQSGEPIINTLSRFIYKRFGVDIPADVWNQVEIPDYLRTRLSIRDHHGKEIRAGRDIPLMLRHRDVPPPDSGSWIKLRDKWEREGLKGWDFDNLPESVSSAHGLTAYPGLKPQADGVDIRLFTTREEALACHKEGVSMLLSQRLVKDIKLLKRNWPLTGEAEGASVYFGGKTAVEKAMLRGLKKQLFHKNILSREEFEAYVLTLSKEMFNKFRELRGHTINILTGYNRTRSSLMGIEKNNKSNNAVLGLCAIIRKDMDAIVPRDFPELYTPERLADIPRYLRAMEIRAERGSNNPGKDSNKAHQVEEFLKALEDMSGRLSSYASNEKIKGIDEFKWMIEEFKVSVFAQELGTAYPVSAKRLNSFKKELERMV